MEPVCVFVRLPVDEIVARLESVGEFVKVKVAEFVGVFDEVVVGVELIVMDPV